MIDFELIEDEDLLLQYKCLFDTITNGGLSDAEEEKLEKELQDCEYEMLNRMNERRKHKK